MSGGLWHPVAADWILYVLSEEIQGRPACSTLQEVSGYGFWQNMRVVQASIVCWNLCFLACWKQSPTGKMDVLTVGSFHDLHQTVSLTVYLQTDLWCLFGQCICISLFCMCTYKCPLLGEATWQPQARPPLAKLVSSDFRDVYWLCWGLLGCRRFSSGQTDDLCIVSFDVLAALILFWIMLLLCWWYLLLW